ncbi:hypothetical protein IF1G_03790 [Cordyceps javanica]|uniref:Uncharacterized protein n=1 Tax=Cordyceps javanica TaxID=43265 RepID=A0A545V8J2_9HYPO|nr:hypothetical protein IF1G_03790 [Cordyceps javanica]
MVCFLGKIYVSPQGTDQWRYHRRKHDTRAMPHFQLDTEKMVAHRKSPPPLPPLSVISAGNHCSEMLMIGNASVRCSTPDLNDGPPLHEARLGQTVNGGRIYTVDRWLKGHASRCSKPVCQIKYRLYRPPVQLLVAVTPPRLAATAPPTHGSYSLASISDTW